MAPAAPARYPCPRCAYPPPPSPCRGFVAAQAQGASGQAGTTLAGSAAKRKPGTGVMASFFDLEASLAQTLCTSGARSLTRPCMWLAPSPRQRPQLLRRHAGRSHTGFCYA